MNIGQGKMLESNSELFYFMHLCVSGIHPLSTSSESIKLSLRGTYISIASCLKTSLFLTAKDPLPSAGHETRQAAQNKCDANYREIIAVMIFRIGRSKRFSTMLGQKTSGSPVPANISDINTARET
jgi:hypothetical protein